MSPPGIVLVSSRWGHLLYDRAHAPVMLPRRMKLSALQHITVIYLMIILFSYLGIVAGKSWVYDENELLENLQALLLLSSCVALLLALPGAEREQRILLLAGALFFLSLLLREVDVEKLGLSRLITLLGSGDGRNIILISLWLIVFVQIAAGYRWYVNTVRALLFSRAGLFYILGGLLLLGGEVLDALSRSYRLQEEIAEVIGNYLLFIAALYTPKTILAASSAEYGSGG